MEGIIDFLENNHHCIMLLSKFVGINKIKSVVLRFLENLLNNCEKLGQ